MQQPGARHSGRRRTLATQPSGYTPSFGDQRVKTRKRSTVGGESRRLAASSSLPDLLQQLQHQDTASPSMSRRQVGPGTRRGFLGFSNGPVTSSASVSGAGAGPRRRHTVHPQLAGDKLAFFESSARPSAPVRSSQVAEREAGAVRGPGPRHAANTMSLDNWLKSLPDTVPGTRPPPAHPGPGEGTPDQTQVQINEIEDVEEESGCIQTHRSSELRAPAPGTPITAAEAREVKQLLLGSGQAMFPPGWAGQALAWNPRPGLRHGLLQERGGPCGVLAATMAATLKVLLAGSDLASLAPAPAPAQLSDLTEEQRGRALAAALAEVLARCRAGAGEMVVAIAGMRRHFSSAGRLRADGVTETLNLFRFSGEAQLFEFLVSQLGFLTRPGNSAVICLLVSCLLTRGPDTVRGDMDRADTALVAAHGYCSQEMVSLVTTGRATSNVFDGDLVLGAGPDTTLLRGVAARAEVGLLSLFEHYRAVTVGSRLKCPAHPIWLVCSESHFTVLWAENGDTSATSDPGGELRLCYYDGLAGQEAPIVVTVVPGAGPPDTQVTSSIEQCIRTKWPGASVDWNGAEKIL